MKDLGWAILIAFVVGLIAYPVQRYLSKPEAETIEEVVPHEDLKDCKFIKQTINGRRVTVIRCPASSTTTVIPGKKTKVVTVVS